MENSLYNLGVGGFLYSGITPVMWLNQASLDFPFLEIEGERIRFILKLLMLAERTPN